MKKFIFILLLFFVSACKNEEIPEEKKFFQTQEVHTGVILDEESYIGYTESFQSVDLGVKVGGKITSLSKKVGDRVQIGEVIGVLDSTEAKVGYTSSNDIIKSLEDLRNSTSEMFESQTQAMQEKIKSAKTGIEISDINSTGTDIGAKDTQNIINSQIQTMSAQIESAKTSLESAELQMENTKNSLDQKEKDIYLNAKTALSQANISGNNFLSSLNSLFGITPENAYKDDRYEVYISAKNTNLKTQIKNDFSRVQSHFYELQKLPIETNEEIKRALEKYNSLFSSDMRKLLSDSFSALENSIESTSFALTTIDAYKSQITSFQNQNEQLILSVSGNYFLGLKGSLDSINNFEKEKKSTLDMLEKQIEMAQKQLDIFHQTKTQIISQAHGLVTEIDTKAKVAKKQKELSENGLGEILSALEALKKHKASSLSEIDTKINEAKSAKNQSGIMIENGKIISLLEGVIIHKFQEVGSIVGPGTPIFTIASDEKIKIQIQLSQEMVSLLHMENPVKVEIEGVGEQKNGMVNNILPTKDPITKKSILEITLDNEKRDIKIGSYAKVYLSSKNDTPKILIPNSAIMGKYMIPQVFVLEKGTAKLKHITIQKQNDFFSEIQGLKLGEKIITTGKENITDGEKLP